MSPAPTVLDPLRAGPASSTALVRALHLPQPTLWRALTTAQREGQVLKIGATRGTRYALLRQIADAGSSWPVFQIDTSGRARELGRLHALMPRHFYFESAHAPLRGLTDGLPWFLADLRPAGFLGGSLAAARPDIGVSPESAWSDDQHISWSSRRGWDCAGDLIVGAEALEGYRASLQQRSVIGNAERAEAFPRLAEQALAGSEPAAQLPGAQPKFTVLADHGGHLVQSLVKFSPPLDSPAGQRWADLMIAEHIAHLHLNARGVGAAHSRVYRYGGRIFLEVDRFDRVGTEGRRGVVSLRAVRAARGWSGESWARMALRLMEAGTLPKNDARQIRLIEAFARLIGNTDLELDNLSLFDHHDGRFSLAPAYDMLPMLFAPGDDARATATFTVPEPAVETSDVWVQARRLAEAYWERLTAEPRLSMDFRALCGGALAALRAVPERATEEEE
jgi:hypothetical protein